MKIICQYAGSAHHSIRLSWINALRFAGHEVYWWRKDKEPIYDVVDKWGPVDWLICESYTLDRATCNIIAQNPEMKVTFVASDFGEESDTVDPKKYHILFARDDEVKLIEKLRAETGKPDFVHCHYFQPYLDITHKHWKDKLGIDYWQLPCCGDVFEYLGGEVKQEYECDGCFLGSWWPYKNINIEKYILPLCHPIDKFKLKIFGANPWPVVQFHGALDYGLEKHLFASSKICMNTHEPHSTDLNGGDINERAYKCALAGKFVLEGGKVNSMLSHLFKNGEIDYALTGKEYQEKFEFYLKNPELRESKAAAAQKVVLKDHTAFDRFSLLFEKLGLPGEAQKMRDKKQEFLLSKGLSLQ